MATELTANVTLDDLIDRRVQADVSQTELGAELAVMTGRRGAVSQRSISLFETGKTPLPHRYTYEQYLEAIERIVARRRRGDEEQARRS